MKNREVKILGVGIATMDIYCHQGKMYPGGNEFNIAYNASLQGAEAAFMGVFADDKVGEMLKQTLAKQGIDTSHSHYEKGSSGYCLVDIRNGDRVFLDWNKQGVTDLYPFVFTEEELNYMKTFDVVAMSLFGRVADEEVIKASKAGVILSYDFGDTFTEERIQKLCPYIRYAFFSCSHMEKEEVEIVLKSAVRCGTGLAIATRGSESALAYDGNGIYEQKISPVEELKDTMGAGDSYISAFLTNYLSEMTADEPHMADDKIKFSLGEAAKYAATVVAKDGSLGVSYGVDINGLNQLINI